jgi:hypothetical protein
MMRRSTTLARIGPSPSDDEQPWFDTDTVMVPPGAKSPVSDCS